MTIRKILVPVTGTDAGLASLGAAFELGRHLDAHVEGLHARRNARDALAYIGEGMTGAMIEELITTAEQESTALAQRARSDFAAACERAGFAQTEARGDGERCTAHLRLETGREEDLIALAGRVADLIVVARAGKDDDVLLRATLEAALLESGRPLLVVPPDGIRGPLATIAIGWNGSTEAAQAVTSALPLLARAEHVAVVWVEEGVRPGPSADDLVDYLAWHDVPVTTHDAKAEYGSTGEALLAQAAEIGAGLMIIGAYTHTRLRRMIFGSATEHMLNAAGIPILMVH
ncbi:MAG: universal stress protein [Alphaproteobacteria bacterium]